MKKIILSLIGLLFFDVSFAYAEDKVKWLYGKATLRPEFRYNNSEFSEKYINLAGMLGTKLKLSSKRSLALEVSTKGSSPRSLFNEVNRSPNQPGSFQFQVQSLYLKEQVGNSIITLGRIKAPITPPTDMLWDKDYHPLGSLITYNNGDSKIKVGYFHLPTISGETWDQTMGLVQYQTDNYSLGWAPAMGEYQDELNFSANSNSRKGNGALAQAFSPIFGHVKLPVENTGPIYQFHLEGVSNMAASSDQTGYLIGLNAGDKSLQKWGDVQVKASYRHLQKDAWLDNLPDGSALSGKTSVEGVEFQFQLGVTPQYQIDLDFYRMTDLKDRSTFFSFQFKNKIRF